MIAGDIARGAPPSLLADQPGVEKAPTTGAAGTLRAVMSVPDPPLSRKVLEQVKALLRLLIAELRVNGKTDIQPTYRIVAPGVCATSEKVETPGIEPGSAIAYEWYLRA